MDSPASTGDTAIKMHKKQQSRNQSSSCRSEQQIGRRCQLKSSRFSLSSSSPVISLPAMLIACCLAATTCVVTSRLASGVQAIQQQQIMHQAAAARQQYQDQNGFQLHDLYSLALQDSNHQRTSESSLENNGNNGGGNGNLTTRPHNQTKLECPGGLLTFELSTGFIYKPTSASDTLSMMPSTLQLTDCLDYCLHNSSCLAINFEMGLCVLLATSAQQNQHNLYSSQFPVFTIYAEKKCLLVEPSQAKHRRRCQRAWTFERVAGYEMKVKPRRRLKFSSKELCMDACLVESEFECRSANWYRQTGECTLSDQDRHSVSQSEAGDQQIKATLGDYYGPNNASASAAAALGQGSSSGLHTPTTSAQYYNHLSLYSPSSAALTGGSPINHHHHQDRSRLQGQLDPTLRMATVATLGSRPFKQLYSPGGRTGRGDSHVPAGGWPAGMDTNSAQVSSSAADAALGKLHHYIDLPASTQVVDYLENNCIYEPNKLCEFRKIQNKVLKTVDSIYQDVGSLDECRQKCLSAPYRCYSFDYGDTSERVCRTSHLDQASLLSVNEPYLEVVGAITYELAACFNVSIQCRAKEMVALVSSSKTFNGKIYAKSRPASCVTDVKQSLQFELAMRYHDEACDVRASSNQFQGVFSQDIVIQHHDRIVTTQDVGLSVYCQYDLGNRSVTNNVDLAIERLPDGPVESKQQQQVAGSVSPSGGGALTIMGLATTVVRSPNVTMRITNMNGLPVTSATVGDRLALMFEIKEKTSPFGILVREIVAMDGRQQQQQQQVNTSAAQMLNSTQFYHHYSSGDLNATAALATPSNSIQFLDSDGCPTDANLMGPLVKMDPHGHRLLAPFDAFKFPTSDMVFFRAVVSSCVAECKPALCPATSAAGGESATNLLSQPPPPPPAMDLSDLASAASSPYGESVMSSLAPPEDDDSDPLAATTRNMQTSSPSLTSRQQQLASTSTTKQFVLTASTSTTAAPPSTVAVASASTSPTGQQQVSSDRSTPTPAEAAAAIHETLERTAKPQAATITSSSSAIGGGGDSLTTVPGFQVADQQQQQQHSTTVASYSPASSSSSSSTSPDIGADSLGRLEQHATINMTNNHNLGRPSPRPLTTTTTTSTSSDTDLHRPSSSGDGDATEQSSERHPVGPHSPGKLDPLTAQERQAILDLLSGHDKSPSSLLSSSSTVSSAASGVNNSPATPGSQLYNEETITSGLMKLYPILDSFRHGNSRSRGLIYSAKQQQQGQTPPAMSSRMVLDEIRAIISDQYQVGGDAGAGVDGNNSSRSPVMTSDSATAASPLARSQKSKRSHLPFADDRQFVEFINRTLIDYIIAEELKSLLLTQMLLDEARSSLPDTSTGGKSARSLDDAAALAQPEPEPMFPLERLNKFYDTMGWPRITPVGPDGHLLPARPEVATDSAQPALSLLQVQRLVKAQFDNQLAADIQHILKLLDDTKQLDARQEIKRSKRQVEEDNLMISTSYVHMDQPQREPSCSTAGATNGRVEMYRGGKPTFASKRRFRRDAPSQPEVVGSEFEAHHSDAHGAPEGPKYEMDEMVVQSIKIVDRLQFEDELQQRKRHPGNRSNGTQRETRWSSNLALARRKQPRVNIVSDSPQAQSGDLDPIEYSSNPNLQEATQPPAPSRSRLSAFNVIMVALCFIFIQISMVLVCVIDWNRQRKQQQQQQQRRSLFANLSPAFGFAGLSPSMSSTYKQGDLSPSSSSSSYCSSVADTPSLHSPATSLHRATILRPTNSRASYHLSHDVTQHTRTTHTLGRRNERTMLSGTLVWPATRGPH